MSEVFQLLIWYCEYRIKFLIFHWLRVFEIWLKDLFFYLIFNLSIILLYYFNIVKSFYLPGFAMLFYHNPKEHGTAVTVLLLYLNLLPRLLNRTPLYPHVNKYLASFFPIPTLSSAPQGGWYMGCLGKGLLVSAIYSWIHCINTHVK